MLLEKVKNTIAQNRLINCGDRIVVALSGGPDSVCLLHALYSLTNKLNIKLYAVHINHMLRGQEADEDEAYARELCQSFGVNFNSVSRDVAGISKSSGISIEEAGREARYQEFYRYADSVGADSIAVAHNREDQAETVLMHIIRGSGLTGLVGMGYKRDRIIRPLLDIQRYEIEEYCLKNALKPRIDSTNLQNIYSRNKIRLDIIPKISGAFGVDFAESLVRLSSLASCDNDFMEHTAAEIYSECVKSSGKGFVHLKLAGLKGLHQALLGRVFRMALNETAGSIKGIESKHIDAMSHLAREGMTGPVIQLPRGIRATISYELLKIYIEEDDVFADFEKTMRVPGLTKVLELDSEIIAEIFEISDAFDEISNAVEKYSNIRYNSLVQFFDYDSLIKGIYIRNRREGDMFKPFKSNGSKKLKEYFIDLKIPRETRSKIPLIASEYEIVWVIRHKISDKFKVTENTKLVLRLEWRLIC
jgi:tRNA(Ile)-lysidine synthase